MKFPLIKNKKTKYPSRNKCAWCGRNKVSEPYSMAVLTGGAMRVDRKRGDGGPDNHLDGFLSFVWHGAHTNEKRTQKNSAAYKTIDIAEDVQGGQFDILFCSTECLRTFLNHAIDRLEQKIRQNNRTVPW